MEKSKETLEERIEKIGESVKEELRKKSKMLLDFNDNNAVTIELIEESWKTSGQNSEKLLTEFYKDITNEEIQKAQISKKKLNY
ncbi:MAG: hypothetical protein Ta2B_18550 [Termitinemataceae bacterium]|nr:MAG: hypothetical protein Ta2B_18550 [Termitinemataceae bacterium]